MSLSKLLQQRFGETSTTEPEADLSGPTIETILRHRSCRNYSTRPVTEELMSVLLGTAFSAPSKSDLQQASVIRVKDRLKRKRIAELTPSTAWAASAPELLVWCGDNRRIRRLCEMRKHPFANDHLDSFMNAAVDAGIAMQTFIIAAESKGLGCCPLSEIRNNIDDLSAELELPSWVFPVAGLCVGWPEPGTRISQRLPMRVTVHENRYDDSDLFDEVRKYDRRREALETTPKDAQRMVDRYGVSDDYGWSENRTRQYSVEARRNFGAYIRRQGFDLS